MARRSLITGALGTHGRLAYPVGRIGRPFVAGPDREMAREHTEALWWNGEVVCSSCGHAYTRALHEVDTCERWLERRGRER